MTLFFASTTLSDLVFLCLLVTRSYQIWRDTNSQLPLMRTLIKDQCALYAITLSVAMLNMVTWIQTANPAIQPIHASLNHCAPALFAWCVGIGSR